MHSSAALTIAHSLFWDDAPVQVVAGAKIPADGKVVEGRSHVDESMVTGESKPATKRVDNTVIGGTVNSTGPLVIQVASQLKEDTCCVRTSRK